MAEIRVTKVEQGQTKFRNVPIAVTPEGFWCCPSPTVFQKAVKTQNPLNKSDPSSPQATKTTVLKKHAQLNERKPPPPPPPPPPPRPPVASDTARPRTENSPRKVAIEFGEAGTSDMKVVLLGKQGFAVKLSVHKNVLAEKSRFFVDKLSEEEGNISSCLEIDNREDVEIYVETVGLMYCKDMKQRLMKQSVSRVLRIIKVAEFLGFNSCIQSCLEYLEAVPWVGEEEEEKVVSSVRRLRNENVGISPVLKRISSAAKPPQETLSQILQLVLKSNEEKGRRQMKSVVLKLLRENSNLPVCAGSLDVLNELIYSSCRYCLSSLLSLFRQVAEPEFASRPMESREPVGKQIALETDNLSWLVEILANRQAADEFALMWASQQELATLHPKLPIVFRYHVNCITARLFVGIGRGELLPSKDKRHLLLQTWLQPLINDYSWLQHGCRSFDRKVVEEGIGRTILTLPLENQQSILLSWLRSFLKSGDNCPNLQRAFEVWWRRAFVRPYVGTQGNSNLHQSDRSQTSKQQT